MEYSSEKVRISPQFKNNNEANDWLSRNLAHILEVKINLDDKGNDRITFVYYPTKATKYVEHGGVKYPKLL